MKQIISQTSSQCSPDILWKCVKKQNAFLHKFNNVELTKDPTSFAARNQKKYSGVTGAGSVSRVYGQVHVTYKTKDGWKKQRLGNDLKADLMRTLGQTRPDLVGEAVALAQKLRDPCRQQA